MMAPTSWTGLALRLCFLAVLALSAATFGTVRPAAAAGQAEQVVHKAHWAVEELLAEPDMEPLAAYLAEAKGVLVFPQLFKGGFIFGGEGGTGVLLAKDEDGTWGQPAFYSLASGSVGLQIGGQVSKVVLTVMNEDAVRAILNNKFKLGADASIAVGPLGRGVEASTTSNLRLDIYAFSKAVGLFGGGALEGAAIVPRDALNSEFYGRAVAPRDIVLHGKVSNPEAEALREVLAQ